jgi:GT2 family glycosyltransferase
MRRLRVAAVILNLNGWEVLRQCLPSVLASTYEPLDVIVVDNGSTDSSPEYVRRDFPSVHLIECEENKGFATGNNLGIEAARRAGNDYVFVLNNDTTIAPDCIEQLVKRALTDSRIGAVAPRILFMNPPDRIWSAGGSYNMWRGVARHAGLRAPAGSPRWNRPRAITFATGCAVLLSATALSEVGDFDDSLFAYNEDADLSYRLRKAGWEIYYEPRAVVWHHEQWTTSRVRGRRWGLALCVRNILRVHAKHARWYHKITFYPYFFWRWIVLAGGNAVLHRRWDVVRGIADGIMAYRRGESGKPA